MLRNPLTLYSNNKQHCSVQHPHLKHDTHTGILLEYIAHTYKTNINLYFFLTAYTSAYVYINLYLY